MASSSAAFSQTPDQKIQERAFAEIKETVEDLFAVGIESEISLESLLQALRANETVLPFLEDIPYHKFVDTYTKVFNTLRKVEERESLQAQPSSKRQRRQNDSSSESSEKELSDDSSKSGSSGTESDKDDDSVPDEPMNVAFDYTIDSLIGKKSPKKELVIPIKIGNKVVPLEMLIYDIRSTGSLIALLRFPSNYNSKFAKAINKVFVLVRFLVSSDDAAELISFDSYRQAPEGKLQTNDEEVALRGIASRVLCLLLKYAREKFILQDYGAITVLAFGKAKGKDRSDLVPKVYKKLGFEEIDPNSVDDSDEQKYTFAVRVKTLRRKCAEFIEDDEDDDSDDIDRT